MAPRRLEPQRKIPTPRKESGAIREWRAIGRDLFADMRQDRVTGLAAEIAFFAVLSIFPWLIALTAAIVPLTAILGTDVALDVKELVTRSLETILTDRASGTVDAVRDLFERQREGLLTVGVILAVWSSSRGFVSVITALNVAYEVQERRSWFARRSRAVLMALGSAVVAALLLVMFVSGPLLGGATRVAELIGIGASVAGIWGWARWPLAFVGLIGWAAVLYRFAPATDLTWRDTRAGAITAATSWLLASLAFVAYLEVAGQNNPIFGTLGGSLILLVWLYLLALGLLVGGEVNSLVTRRRPPP